MVFRTFSVLVLLIATLVLSNPIAAQRTPPKPTAPDLKGSVTNGIYTNKYFGFEMTLPKEWMSLESEDSKAAVNMTAEATKSGNRNANSVIDNAVDSSTIILFYAKHPLGAIENPSIGIAAAKQPSKFVTSKMILEATKSAYLKNPKTTVTKEIRFETFDGRQFAAIDFELEMPAARVPLTILVLMVHGYSLTFSLSAQDAESKERIEMALQSIKFLAKVPSK
jgi:hypothetical protein